MGVGPPFTGLAVKVIGVPLQRMADGVSVTAAAPDAITFMVIVLLVAGLPVGQDALDVNCTLITSPLTRVDVT